MKSNREEAKAPPMAEHTPSVQRSTNPWRSQDVSGEVISETQGKNSHMGSPRMRGFSLIEMMTVVTLVLIVTGIAVTGIQPALKYSRVNNAYNTTLAAIRQTRDFAVSQRQEYSVTFNNAVSPNTITITQITQTGTNNAVTTYQLPIDVTYTAVSGIPTAPNAVPDGFGAGATAIDFDQGIAGGIQNVIYFLPDGTGQDINGNINNGVIYIARAGELYSSHAITVWGTTGRIRGWKLYGDAGTPIWRQN
jgi:prepilin-type N-terminal cleavage/methylation domain-containing protein